MTKDIALEYLEKAEKEYKKMPWLAKVLSLKDWSHYMYLKGAGDVMQETINNKGS